MKKGLLVLSTVLALMMSTFGAISHAAVIGAYDLSNPKDGDVDGSDLAALIGSPGPNIAEFASLFGQTYNVTARRPNILLIIGDDIGMDVVTDMYPGLIDGLEDIYGVGSGVRGTPAITPVLDSLASQGMRFSNAWAQPFCSPTRASIITGLFTAKHNVTTYATYLSDNHNSFVKKLRDEAGYSTAAFGKWHLAGFPVKPVEGMMPKEAGFELFKGILGAAPSSYWTPTGYVMQNDSTGDEDTVNVNWQPRELDGIGPTTYLPVVKVADTIDWINEKQTQNADKPWFAYLAMNLSHAKSGSPMMVVPDEDTLNCDENTEFCNEIRSCSENKFGSASEVYNGTGTCNGVQLMRAMTTSMDTVIGKLMEAVDSIPSDTYVIYISDNGTPMYSSDPITLGYQIGNMYITRAGRGKGTAYESGARVAMVIKGPGIEADKSIEFVHAADLFSTILELAGLTPPESVSNSTGTGTVPLDSVSLTPILFDSTDTVRDPDTGFILTDAVNIMGTSTTWVGARNARYKLVCSGSSSNCNYYDLAGDPSEGILGDPLEESPITDSRRPSSCTDYNNLWAPADPQWNYCHLKKMINDNSIF